MRVRPATSEDSIEILRWRNDLNSRLSSRNSEIIPFEAHQVWFEQVMSDPERVLLIGENTDGQPMGQVRFDRMRTEPDTYEVSITIAPEARGRGFSLQLLTAAEDQLLQTTGFLILRAYVDVGNKVSERLFETGGYSIISSVETPGQWWKKEIHV